MHKVVIVDDDIETLTGLREFIDWKAYGFSVCATASSAEVALPILRAESPALLVTDITMTGDDGFSLLAHARKELPQLEAIILTCHADFSFARSAIDADVAAYLTKVTVTEEELGRALERVRERIARSSTSLQDQLAQQRALRELLARDAAPVRELARAGLWGSAEPVAIRVALVAPADPAVASAEAAHVLDDQTWLMTEVAPRVPEAVVTIGEGSAVVIVDPLTAESPDYDAFIVRVKAVMATISERYECDATASVSSRTSLDIDLVALYNQLRTRVMGAFYQSGDVLVRPESSQSVASFTDEAPPRDPAVVAEQLVGPAHAAALAALEKELAEWRTLPERVQEFVRRVCDQLQVLAGSGSPQLPRISGVRRLSRMIERLATAAELVRTAREEHGEISARGDINRVARHVREHIAEPISAESMADLAGMSLAHFSRVFKKASGLTFSEYLTLTRIDVAKHRLRTTDDTIDEIARVSGFENVAYFHRVFKRKTGVTPGDYRGLSRTLEK